MNRKQVVTVLLICGLIFASGCQQLEKALRAKGLGKEADAVKTATLVGTVAFPFSVDQEVEIGRAMAARIIEMSGGIYPDENLNRYVNLVGRAVAINVSREDLSAELYQFAVVNTDEINAIAMPGGYIIITMGALKAIGSEAELAGVLAHEIAHIDKGHLLKAIKSEKGLELLSQMADAYNKNDNESLNKSLFTSSESGIGTLFTKGLSRENEEEADETAVKLLVKTGYQPTVLTDFLNRIKEKKDSSFMKTLSATHPDTSHRIKTIDKYLAEKGWNNFNGQKLEERYKTALQGVK